MPPRVPPATTMTGMRPAASSYARPRSALACSAMASAAWIVPVMIPGGNPVTEVPGWTPKSPVMAVVAPVLVTSVPAKTAKDAAVRRLTDVGLAAFAVPPPVSMLIARVTAIPAESSNLDP